MAEKFSDIAMMGLYNFRDLGGIAVAGGEVKSGLLYRSDDLSELSRSDLDKLAAHNLTTVIDFRGIGEASVTPDRYPNTVKNRISLPIEAGKVVGRYADNNLNQRGSMGMMISVYRALVNDFKEVYREFFHIVSQPDNAPLLFHCTAGKDRTGVAAALLLSALGADRDAIEHDYLISRQNMASKFRLGSDYDSDIEPLYSVYPEFLQAAYQVIDNQYGGMVAYLKETLDVDQELLKTMYVQPVK